MKDKEFVTIGQIVTTHGIHGKLRVEYYNDEKTHFFSYRRIFLRDPSGRIESFAVLEARVHKKLLIVRLEGVNSIDEAERLVGFVVLIERATLAKLEEGEYYWTDLIGMEVVTDEGKPLGRLAEIIRTGGADVFVVTSGDKEVLIPATEEAIKQVDVDAQRVVVHPIEGLTEDDSV